VIFLEGEDILEDDYPIYFGYIYIFDGEILGSKVTCTVGDFKEMSGIKEIRRCEIVKRKLI
jgi:hypothetical protein